MSDEGKSFDVTGGAATKLIDLYTKLQEQLLAEHSAMTRWLTASLLVINGGGALATFNAADRLSHPAIEGAVYVAGITASLFVAVLNQRANKAGSVLLAIERERAFGSALTGEFEKREDDSSGGFQTAMQRLGRPPVLMGWASAALFASASTLLAADKPPNRELCRIIQRDMLSASPRRSDSRELFAALSCKPTAGASVYALPSKAEQMAKPGHSIP